MKCRGSLQSVAGFAVFFVLGTMGCVQRGLNEENVEVAAATKKPTSPVLGPTLPSQRLQQALASYSSTNLLVNDYAVTANDFRSVYGNDFNPYNLAIVRSSRFISRNGWDRNKDVTQYNPIIMTDKYVNEKENTNGAKDFCRRPGFNGQLVNVWESFDRASVYVDQLTRAGLSGSSFPWYRSYLSAAVPRAHFLTNKLSTTQQSPTFDLNVFLSLHVAGGEGATQDASTCGRLGQVKMCDVMPYSPFFKPSLAATPCTGAGGWSPTPSEWAAMLSPEMRALGQTAIPLPAKSIIANLTPRELGGATCGSAQGAARESAWRNLKDPTNDGWAELRRSFPAFSEDAMARGASYVGSETQAGRVGAFAVYAGVQQTYKELVNMRLKPDVLVNDPQCKPCGLVRDSSGRLMVDVAERKQSGLGFCPISFDPAAYTSSGQPARDSTGRIRTCISKSYVHHFRELKPETDPMRAMFEPDVSDAQFPSMGNVMTSHFREIRSGNLTDDPIRRATYIQQKTVAMHPFIDGDGRLSRFLMESILHSVGLPFPMMTDFWADTQTSTADYTNLVRNGVARQIGAIKACTAFARCEAQAQTLNGIGSGGLAVSNVCGGSASNRPAAQCASNLTFSYGSGQSDTLKPCDCNALWSDNPRVVKWPVCKI
jgi:hypothetical protein